MKSKHIGYLSVIGFRYVSPGPTSIRSDILSTSQLISAFSRD